MEFVPEGVVTTTSTVPAMCAGVLQVMLTLLTTTSVVQFTPPKVTEVAPVKLMPVIVTGVPPMMVPEDGLMLWMAGSGDSLSVRMSVAT